MDNSAEQSPASASGEGAQSPTGAESAEDSAVQPQAPPSASSASSSTTTGIDGTDDSGDNAASNSNSGGGGGSSNSNINSSSNMRTAPASPLPPPSVNRPSQDVSKQLQREYYSVRFPRRFSSLESKELKSLAEVKFEQTTANKATGALPSQPQSFPSASANAAGGAWPVSASASASTSAPPSLTPARSRTSSLTASKSLEDAAALDLFASASTPTSPTSKTALSPPTSPRLNGAHPSLAPLVQAPPASARNEARIQKLIRQVYIASSEAAAAASSSSSSSSTAPTSSPIRERTKSTAAQLRKPSLSSETSQINEVSAAISEAPTASSTPALASSSSGSPPADQTSQPSQPDSAALSEAPDAKPESLPRKSAASDAPSSSSSSPSSPSSSSSSSPLAKRHRSRRHTASAAPTLTVATAQLPDVYVSIPYSVVISPTLLSDKNSFRVFHIIVSTDYGQWAVRRRYSDFVQLDKGLRVLKFYTTLSTSISPAPSSSSGSSSPISTIGSFFGTSSAQSSSAAASLPQLIPASQELFSLPPKLYLNPSEEDIDKRRQSLEMYLRRAVASVHISRTKALWDFLCKSETDDHLFTDLNTATLFNSNGSVTPAPATTLYGRSFSTNSSDSFLDPAASSNTSLDSSALSYTWPSTAAPFSSSVSALLLDQSQNPSEETGETDAQAKPPQGADGQAPATALSPSPSASPVASPQPVKKQRSKKWSIFSSFSSKSIDDAGIEEDSRGASANASLATEAPQAETLTPQKASSTASSAAPPQTVSAAPPPYPPPPSSFAAFNAEFSRQQLSEQLASLVRCADSNGCITRPQLLAHLGFMFSSGESSRFITEFGDRICTVIRHLGSTPSYSSANPPSFSMSIGRPTRTTVPHESSPAYSFSFNSVNPPQNIRIVHVLQFLRTMQFGSPEEKLALGFRFIDLDCKGFFTCDDFTSAVLVLRGLAQSVLQHHHQQLASLLLLISMSASISVSAAAASAVSPVSPLSGASYGEGGWSVSSVSPSILEASPSASGSGPHLLGDSATSAEAVSFVRACVELFAAMNTTGSGRVWLRDYTQFCLEYGVELASLGLVGTKRSAFLQDQAQRTKAKPVPLAEPGFNAEAAASAAELHPNQSPLSSGADDSPPKSCVSAWLAQPCSGKPVWLDGSFHFDFILSTLSGIRLCLAVTNDEYAKQVALLKRTGRGVLFNSAATAGLLRSERASGRVAGSSRAETTTLSETPPPASFVAPFSSVIFSSFASAADPDAPFSPPAALTSDTPIAVEVGDAQSADSSSPSNGSLAPGSFDSTVSAAPAALPALQVSLPCQLLEANFPTLKRRIVALPAALGGGSMKEHSPHVFRAVRAMYNVDENEFSQWLSPELVFGSILLGHSNVPTVRDSDGKSKSLFYQSRDGRFILKTVSSSEHHQLKVMSQSYLNYICTPENAAATLLSRIYGHFTIRGTPYQQGQLVNLSKTASKSAMSSSAVSANAGTSMESAATSPPSGVAGDANAGAAQVTSSPQLSAVAGSGSTGTTANATSSSGGIPIHFVIMGNVFFDPGAQSSASQDIRERFDLKGSTLGRNVEDADVPGRVLKDVNFTKLQRALHLSPENSARLAAQIEKDSIFLQSLGIIDYSLLLGVQLQPAPQTHKGKSVRSAKGSDVALPAKASSRPARDNGVTVLGAISDLADIFSIPDEDEDEDEEDRASGRHYKSDKSDRSNPAMLQSAIADAGKGGDSGSSSSKSSSGSKGSGRNSSSVLSNSSKGKSTAESTAESAVLADNDAVVIDDNEEAELESGDESFVNIQISRSSARLSEPPAASKLSLALVNFMSEASCWSTSTNTTLQEILTSAVPPASQESEPPGKGVLDDTLQLPGAFGGALGGRIYPSNVTLRGDRQGPVASRAAASATTQAPNDGNAVLLRPVYYLAIVDMLTCYTWVKRAERLFRGSASFDFQSVSSAPPNVYGPRFVKFCKSIIASTSSPSVSQ